MIRSIRAYGVCTSRSDGAADEPSWLIASGLGESRRRNWALTSGLERSALRTSSGSGSEIVPTGPRGTADPALRSSRQPGSRHPAWVVADQTPFQKVTKCSPSISAYSRRDQ